MKNNLVRRHQRHNRFFKCLNSCTDILIFAYNVYLCLTVIRHVHLRADVADAAGHCLHSLHHLLRCREYPVLSELRPLGHHQRLLLRYKRAVNLLSDKRHKRMEKF